MTNRRARSVEPAGQSFFVHSIPRADPLLYHLTATPPIFGFCSRAKSTSRTTTASLSLLPFLRPALRTRPPLPSLYVRTHLASHCCASPDSLPCLMLILAPARSPPRRLCRQLRRRAMPRTIGVGSPLAQPTAQPPQNDMSAPAAPPPDHDAFAMEEDEALPSVGSAPPPPLPPAPPQQPNLAAAFSTTRKDVRVWPGTGPLPLHVIDMLDRRRTPPANETWVMQADLNEILYSSPPTAAAPYRSRPTGGALYQLLGRTPGAQGRALMLRRALGDGRWIPQAPYNSHPLRRRPVDSTV